MLRADPPAGEVPRLLGFVDYSGIFETGDWSDLTLQGANGSIRCHSLILGATSPLLKSVFLDINENLEFENVLILPDFSVDDLAELVRVLYGIENDRERCKDVILKF